MDNHEEKLTKIRQVIRGIILPLLEDMYNKDPTDVKTFCCDYFHNLSQRREENVSHLDTQGSKYVGEVNHKKKEVESTDEVIHQIHSNLQGSSSEPILTSEKSCKGKTLRGTSSWILPPSHPYMIGSCRVTLDYNSANVMSSIDDQQSPKDERIEFENAAEGGDTIAIQKEVKVGENESYVENDTSSQEMSKATSTEVRSFPTLTSAPIHANFYQKFNQISKEKDPDSPKHGKFSDAIEETKIGCKNVFPNSSCGFIPHLSECYSEEEFSKSNSECYDDLSSTCSKTTEDIQKLTKRLSATLQSLAQDFRSAEINFDEEFQNAKEISDVIQRRLETKEGNECLGMTQDLDEDSDNDNGRKDTDKNLKFIEADFNQANDENNSELHIDKDVFEPEFTKSPSKLRESPVVEVTGGFTNENSLNFPEDGVRHGTVRDSSEFRRSSHHLSKQQSDSSSFQDEYRSDSDDSRIIIDESWRKRWYDAHPLLDSTSDGLQKEDSILFRGCNIVDRNRRNEAIHRIGEAGDIPKRSGGNPFTTEDLRGSLDSCLEPSHEDPSSPLGEEYEPNNASSGEILDIRRRTRPGGAARNLSDKDIPLSIPSQSIPYSWRHMCKPRASSLERKEKGFKQFKRKLDEEKLDSGNGTGKELNANTSASHQPENATVVARETGETTDFVSSNPNPNKQEEFDIHEISEENASGRSKSMSCANKHDAGTQAKHFSFDLDKPASSDNQRADGGADNKFKFQGKNNDSCIKEEMEIANHNSTCGKENTNELNLTQRNESSEKIEPGLMSAGGDFAVPLISENNEQISCIIQQPREECMINNGELLRNDGIPREDGPEEMIEVGTEQKNEDSFEGLNFSTDSESDISIDYSDSEDDYDSTSNV